jgi:hypothetical protein
VAAGIPTSVLVVMALNRREAGRVEREEERRGRAMGYPPVVVIQGGGGVPGLPAGGQAGYWPMPMPGPQQPRQFHVVGGDDLVVEDPTYWNR